MTMHLLRGVSTLSNRKPKFKMTKAKYNEWQLDWQEYNRDQKRQGLPKISFEEYCDYRLGRKKKSNTVSKPAHLSTSLPTMSDHRKAYPSLSTNTGNTYRNESMQYTGTLVRGIATMHKSNAVPVIDEQQMQEISRMRRG